MLLRVHTTIRAPLLYCVSKKYWFMRIEDLWKIWMIIKLILIDYGGHSGLFRANQKNTFMILQNIQSKLVIRNFLVTLKLFLDAKCSLSLWSKLTIGHGKWFLNTNLFLIKTFLITKFDCIFNLATCTLYLTSIYPLDCNIEQKSTVMEHMDLKLFLEVCNFIQIASSEKENMAMSDQTRNHT